MGNQQDHPAANYSNVRKSLWDGITHIINLIQVKVMLFYLTIVNYGVKSQ